MKFFIVFSLCIIASYIMQAVSYIRRIAEALEDLVYGDEKDAKEKRCGYDKRK